LGPRGHYGSVMLILGASRDDLLKRFRTVEPVGWLHNPLGLPDESGQTLWLCRDRFEPLPKSLAKFAAFRLTKASSITPPHAGA
jgi:hypothetical protein